MADTTVPFQNADASKINITSIGGETIDSGAPDDGKGGNDKPADDKTTTQQVAKALGGQEQVANDDPDPDAGEKKDGEGEETGEGNANASGKEGEESGEYTEEQFTQDVNTLITNTTGGKVKSLDQITTIISDYNKLKADYDKKEPVFPSPEAKAVYTLATKAVGAEVKTAKQLFHILSLPDLSTMTPKEKQFEAFCLERPNLSREDAQKRFEAMYEKTYNDLENDLLQTDAHEQATVNAEAKITAKLKEFEETVKQSGTSEAKTGPTEAEITKMNAELDQAVDSFGGVSLKLDDSQYGTLKIPMDAGKAQEFKEFLKNPYSLIDQIADAHRDESGNLKMSDFIREMFLLKFRDHISQEERNHLMKLGKVAQIKEAKNTGKTSKQEQSTTQQKGSFADAFAAAVGASN